MSCVDALTLDLAAKHKSQERERQHKKRDIQLVLAAPTSGGQVGQLYTSGVSAALLLTCAVIFL